jgi:hypothetical protein
MTESSHSQHRVFLPGLYPPENEIPRAVASSHVVWRGEGAVIAVPSLLVYTTGIWLLVIFRSRDRQPADIGDARATSEALRGLTVNGRSVDLLGGEHHGYGFTYLAWSQFRGDDAGAGADFGLQWPGVEPATHHVDGIAEARSRVTVLWPHPES